jgi:hypothetical protein
MALLCQKLWGVIISWSWNPWGLNGFMVNVSSHK